MTSPQWLCRIWLRSLGGYVDIVTNDANRMKLLGSAPGVSDDAKPKYVGGFTEDGQRAHVLIWWDDVAHIACEQWGGSDEVET